MDAPGWARVVKISLDFETFSGCDLQVAGAWKYSEDPSTEVLMMAWAVDDEEPEIWLPGDPFPQRIRELVDQGATLHAWNAAFEMAVWHLAADFPLPPVSQWRCSMACAAYQSYPLSLDTAAIAAGVAKKKDKAGKALIRKFCLPRRRTKNNPSRRILPGDDPLEFASLINYCKQDVRAERAVVQSLPLQELPAYEQRVWEFDFEMNRRGVSIDVAAVSFINPLIDEHIATTERRVGELTGGLATGQRAAITAWARSEGAAIDSYTIAGVRECLERADTPPNVAEVLRARQSVGKTSTAKYKRIMETVCIDGTTKGLIQYYGANTTGRYAGRLWQIHNLPRGKITGGEYIAEFADRLTLADYSTLYHSTDPMQIFSSLIRPMIIPASEDDAFYVADFSNVEGRVLAWMAGQDDLVEQFRSGDDVYKRMACTIFKTAFDQVTHAQRFVGKTATLGCGYGMGAAKFTESCVAAGQDVSTGLGERAVRAYREKNNKIPEAWYAVEKAARAAIVQPGKTVDCFMCRFRVEKGFLIIQLPSGRHLFYSAPVMEAGDICYTATNPITRKWTRQSTYGGRLVENIVQATARDLLVAAMFGVDRAGYTVVTTIHDEIVATAKRGTSMGPFMAAMRAVPAWANGCPVDAEGWTGARYHK